MKRNEIIAKLKEILLAADDSDRAAIAACTETSNLISDLGFSSVAMLYMVISVEEAFGVRFDDASMSDLDTLGKVADYIEARVK